MKDLQQRMPRRHLIAGGIGVLTLGTLAFEGISPAHADTSQSQANLVSVTLINIDYLRNRNLTYTDWVAFVGSRASHYWDKQLDRAFADVLPLIYSAIQSYGIQVTEVSRTPTSAQAICTNWPDPTYLSYFQLNITPQEADPFWDMLRPITKRYQIQYTWRRSGDQVTLNFIAPST